MADFPSAVQAVRAAVQFQTRIKELTIGDAEDRRIALRVGVNIGDVIVEPHDGGKSAFQTRPAGNAVNLEDQMLKVSANQMDYAAATSLYSRSLGLIKTAIGKR